MGLKSVFEQTYLHALPHAVEAKNLTARIFWSVVFLIALAFVSTHTTFLVLRYKKHEISTTFSTKFLVLRYKKHEVSTTFSTKFDQNVTKPVVYLTLFFPHLVQSDFPFETLLIGKSYSVFEFSNWTNTSVNGLYLEVNFCAAAWDDLQVYRP